MATDDTAPITFAVPGQSGPPAAGVTRGGGAAAAALPGHVKASVRVGAQRDGAAPVQVTAVPDEDIVAVHIENGPVLLLHPATARDLMLGAAGRQRGTAEVAVQTRLAWPGAAGGATTTRDMADMSGIEVSAFQVLTGLVKDEAIDFVAGRVVQRVDGQVDAGVYALQPDRLERLKGSVHKRAQIDASADPVLVLLHGSFVDTTSTFEKLWLGHRAGVDRLFQHYKGAVYALDHPTLSASPIANARTLVEALPDGTRLHLASHSRGGLVAEVLARVIGQNGVDDTDLAYFADADHEAQRQELRDLSQLVKGRSLSVERVVRVACPARGTLLASKRLDAYLSVLKWTMQLAGVPVLPTFVDFLAEVARRRADPSIIPGLAAMIPGAPLLEWLNAVPQPLPGDLRVVSGDLQGDSLGSWLKALLADAYFWTDNDVIVQTRSMYGGAPRSGGSSFLLDQSPEVTHFNYFGNQKTADAVVDGLISAQAPAGFKTIGPLSWAGEDASGERGGSFDQTRSAPDPTKPAVFVLPGIVGSNLKQGLPPRDQRIWLSARLLGGFDRLAYQPGGADHVADDGPIGLVYDRLLNYLEASHEVIPFGYDWRRPVEEEAKRLADRMRLALDARQTTGRPVRVLAHSMGGLLARAVQWVAPDVWARMMAHADARLVMLGTPNGGSWAPMQVLSGDDTFGNALAAIGSPFANRRARNLMARMPGFLQLQAGLLDPRLGLDKESTWRKLAQDDLRREQERSWWQRYAGDVATAAYEWGVPPQAVLDQACALRSQLDAQLVGALKTSAKKMRLVVGHAKSTPDGFELGSEGLVYLDLQDGGDGRVPLPLALLPGVDTWTLNCEHGSMPSARNAFEAYADLLVRGTTTRLQPLATTRDGAATPTHLRSRPSRRPAPARPAGGVAEVMGSVVADAADSAGRADSRSPAGPARLQIQLLNGNITFVRQPLMLGHYRSLELTGTESVVDSHLGGAMTTALKAGLYPDAPGSQRIFVNTQSNKDNPWQLPRPEAAIVIGLGEEGALDSTRLAESVCQGVKAWAQRASENGQGAQGGKGEAGIELAATLIGSGGLGMTPGATARAIAQGVRLANQRLAGTAWPQVRKLTLVEWYLDRAGEAWRGLRVLAQASPLAFDLAPTIASGTAPLRRQPESGYRGADYDLINTATASDGTIAFALDTRRARTEVRAQRTQPKLVGKLVKLAATARKSDPKLGSTLFQLLVPLELKPFLSGNDRVVLQLDAGTAPIPWELLDTAMDTGGDESAVLPWAIRSKLLRKLAVADFRERPRDTDAHAAVLVIGEPLITGDNYPALPGALSEAKAVVQQLTGAGGIAADRVTALVDADPFDAIIMALMARPYRIVHIAGHGAAVQFDADKKTVVSRGGVVLSEGVFLGPDEIEKLPEVPELVFVNCCHLGSIDIGDGSGALKIDEPVAFAAGVAESLIKIGVRCVVAAGWAVDDRPAEVFAQAFYRTLLAGQPFVEAVAAARQAAWQAAPRSKTWAAYQCYGDPNWVFVSGGREAEASEESRRDEFEGLPSALGLTLALESLAIRTRYDSAKTPEAAAKQRQESQRQVRGLQDRYGAQWGGMGAVAEAFAVTWDAAGDIEQAIAWYAKALQANDASASLKAHEQYGNLRVSQAWDLAKNAKKGSAAMDDARKTLTGALGDLQALVTVQPTIERLSLCGSAWKRLAQLEDRAGDAAQYKAALVKAADFYGRAEALAIEQDDPQQFYPGGNRLAIEMAMHAGEPGWVGPDEGLRLRQLRSLQAKHAADPDFWSSVALVETDLFQVLAQRQLAGSAQRLRDAYADLHRRVPAQRYWESVADQARFVLTPYLGGVDAVEQRAALDLLAALEAYAA